MRNKTTMTIRSSNTNLYRFENKIWKVILYSYFLHFPFSFLLFAFYVPGNIEIAKWVSDFSCYVCIWTFYIGIIIYCCSKRTFWSHNLEWIICTRNWCSKMKGIFDRCWLLFPDVWVWLSALTFILSERTNVRRDGDSFFLSLSPTVCRSKQMMHLHFSQWKEMKSLLCRGHHHLYSVRPTIHILV